VWSQFDEALEGLVETPSSGRVPRLLELVRYIPFPRTPGTVTACELRYQLLTAVAGTLAFAGRRGVKRAILVVEEFRTTVTSDRARAENASDLDRFVARLSRNKVQQVIHELWLALSTFLVPHSSRATPPSTSAK
jgi:hypothetical protein